MGGTQAPARKCGPILESPKISRCPHDFKRNRYSSESPCNIRMALLDFDASITPVLENRNFLRISSSVWWKLSLHPQTGTDAVAPPKRPQIGSPIVIPIMSQSAVSRARVILLLLHHVIFMPASYMELRTGWRAGSCI